MNTPTAVQLLLNSSFEETPNPNIDPPDFWTRVTVVGTVAVTADTVARTGTLSLKLQDDGGTVYVYQDLARQPLPGHWYRMRGYLRGFPGDYLHDGSPAWAKVVNITQNQSWTGTDWASGTGSKWLDGLIDRLSWIKHETLFYVPAWWGKADAWQVQLGLTPEGVNRGPSYWDDWTLEGPLPRPAARWPYDGLGFHGGHAAKLRRGGD